MENLNGKRKGNCLACVGGHRIMVVLFGFIELISARLASWCDDLAVCLSDVVELAKNKGYEQLDGVQLDGVLLQFYEDLPLKYHADNIFIDSERSGCARLIY